MKSSGQRKTANLPTAEEDDALWRLLGKCPPRKASGAFVADTLRATRLDAARRDEGRFSLGWRLWVPALLGMAVIALTLAWHRPWTLTTEPGISLHTEEVDLLREELHLMTYVDELLTVSDPTTLDDDGLAELF